MREIDWTAVELRHDGALDEEPETNYRGERLVRGDAADGDRVAYEDIANPRREGYIGDSRNGPGGVEYLVLWDGGELVRDDDPGFIWSDLRQYGWVFA